MAYERPPGVRHGPGNEPLPLAVTGVAREGADPAVALRLQILSTEHWSLLGSRSLAWNESFSRAAMFLSTVTGSIVALALVAQVSEFGQSFRLFALVILPVVLFIGVGTVLRIGESNYHDAMCVVGMNRIRAGYLEMAPDLERFFVTGTHDDMRGVAITMAIDTQRPLLVHMLAATPMMIATLNSVLLGAIAGLLAIQLGAVNLLALGLAAVGFLVGWVLHAWLARRAIARGPAAWSPQFPSPPHDSMS
jgi:hypothetical protein